MEYLNTHLKPNIKIGMWLYFLTFLFSCKDDNIVIQLATVNTGIPTDIKATNAQLSNTIDFDGGAPIVDRGTCWSILPNPVIDDNRSNDGTGTGRFNSVLSQLDPNTIYYARAYAINELGVAYGESKEFLTQSGSIDLLTTQITDISINAATSGGEITNDGGDEILARGVCWSTLVNPTIEDNKTLDGIGLGVYFSSISNLALNTKYYLRSYATNGVGTSYGAQEEFTTRNGIPTLTTTTITNATINSATSGGNIIEDGGDPILVIGICWSTFPNPTINDNKTTNGNTLGDFTASITAILPNTTYYVRSYATNSTGTNYGSSKQFTSRDGIAQIETSPISGITLNSASAGGEIFDNGGDAIIERGICWNTSGSPTIANNKTSDGSGIGNFSSSMGGLSINTVYYVKSYATNSTGTTYGDEKIVKTYSGSVSDIDGNNYYTVTIGTQIWMAENLATTKFNDGVAIPLIIDDTEWKNLTTSGFSWYNNDETTYRQNYGGLYNWHTTSSSKICPIGWHIPSNTEWTLLTDYLGGKLVAGGKIKETGMVLWDSPNTGATNESGFSAVPAGSRQQNAVFSEIGGYGFWWSNLDYSTTSAWYYFVGYKDIEVTEFLTGKQSGLSIRCLKN